MRGLWQTLYVVSSLICSTRMREPRITFLLDILFIACRRKKWERCWDEVK